MYKLQLSGRFKNRTGNVSNEDTTILSCVCKFSINVNAIILFCSFEHFLFMFKELFKLSDGFLLCVVLCYLHNNLLFNVIVINLVAKIRKVNELCKKKDPKFCEANSFSYFCNRLAVDGWR